MMKIKNDTVEYDMVNARYTSLQFAIVPFLPNDDVMKVYIEHLCKTGNMNEEQSNKFCEQFFMNGWELFILCDFNSHKKYITSTYEIGNIDSEDISDSFLEEFISDCLLLEV